MNLAKMMIINTSINKTLIILSVLVILWLDSSTTLFWSGIWTTDNITTPTRLYHLLSVVFLGNELLLFLLMFIIHDQTEGKNDQ